MTTPALLIAAHGTRVPEGQDAARALAARVARLLPEVTVRDSYVELTDPPIPDALAELAASGPVVVVPLMVGAGGHVLEDIPEAIGSVPGAVVARAEHLGPDPRLRAAARARIAAASEGWAADEVAVVFLGRGCSVADANADHVRLGRMLWEEGGYAHVTAAFIQVTHPTLAEGLDAAYATGARRVVVSPHFLFPGRLERWAHQQVAAWSASHPDCEVRVAAVIGDCDDLAHVVIDRYRAAARVVRRTPAPDSTAVYLSGLRLRGRRVLVAGAGSVATRRLPALVASGAVVTVVAPVATPQIAAWAESGTLRWEVREVADADVHAAWYVLAATDSPEVNARLAAVAESQHTFCVRADRADGGSAWTPATGVVGDLTVGVVGQGVPRRSAAARDAAVDAVGLIRRA